LSEDTFIKNAHSLCIYPTVPMPEALEALGLTIDDANKYNYRLQFKAKSDKPETEDIVHLTDDFVDFMKYRLQKADVEIESITDKIEIEKQFYELLLEEMKNAPNYPNSDEYIQTHIKSLECFEKQDERSVKGRQYERQLITFDFNAYIGPQRFQVNRKKIFYCLLDEPQVKKFISKEQGLQYVNREIDDISKYGYMSWQMTRRLKMDKNTINQLADGVLQRTDGKWKMILKQSDVGCDANNKEATMAMFALANGHQHVVDWLENECGAKLHQAVLKTKNKNQSDRQFAQGILGSDYFKIE